MGKAKKWLDMENREGVWGEGGWGEGEVLGRGGQKRGNFYRSFGMGRRQARGRVRRQGRLFAGSLLEKLREPVGTEDWFPRKMEVGREEEAQYGLALMVAYGVGTGGRRVVGR